MRKCGRMPALLMGVFAAALLAGCGASATTSATRTSGATLVSTGQAAVQGETLTVLTDAQGHTLYFYDRDTATSVSCSGSCAQTWLPLLAGGQSVHALAGVSGTFSVVQGANGPQVAYNGHPLYTYSSDTDPGQATGEGMLGLWHVALPTTPAR